MPNILVVYASWTGNTKKVAEAIHEELEGNTTLKPVDEAVPLDDFALIFIGFPVHSHSVPFKVEELLRKIPPGKKIALFSTHGSLTGSRLSREALEHASALASKAKILGTFSCRGKVSLQAMEVLRKSPEHNAWVNMAASARTHPDAHDLEDARAFARWVMTLYQES
ncbi:MAG: flavodoxin family protein [Candidatus Aminicenantales bacterium]